MNVAIILASAGRPHVLADALATCAAQTHAFVGVVSVPDEASLPDDRSQLDGWRVVTGVRGLSAQRNAGIDALPAGIEVVAFFDDDAVLRPDYLTHALALFAAEPAVVGLTGRVLLDGATTGEIDRAVAGEVLERSAAETPTGHWRPTRELYGCNFAYRYAMASDLRFDERLPLYSWLEDHDFARRLMPAGQLAAAADCVIVHRAAASGGRAAHTRLGYSQLMNPVYLARKGSFPVWLAVQQIFRPVAKNLALSVFGPTASWRRERVAGNLLALADVARGRITPERIAKL